MKTKFLKLFLVLLLIIIISFILINLLNKSVSPYYMNYAESEMKRVVTTVINKTVNEINFDDNLFLVSNDNSGTIVDYDPMIMNRIISNISNNVYDNLKLIENGDKELLKRYNIDSSIFYVPSGIIFNSLMLNNLGPKIPIKLELIESVNPNIETKVTEYGINNSLIEVSIKVTTTVRTILPLSTKDMEISVIVPLTVKIIQGNIPEYYFGSFRKNNS